MTNRRLEQKEIDLEFFFYQILEQWRVLLLVGILFAVSFSVGALVKKTESVWDSEQQSETVEISNPVKNTVRLYFVYYNSREEYANEAMDILPEEGALEADALATAYQNYSDSLGMLSGDDKEMAQAIINNATRNNKTCYDMKYIDSCVAEYYSSQEPEKISVLKFCVIGFVVGICSCILFEFFLLVFCRTFVCEKEINWVMHTRNFGSIYDYPYKSYWGRFAHSKRIYNLYHRGVENDKIISDLGQKIIHEKCNKLTLLMLGCVDEKYNIFLQDQAKLLAEQGVDTNVVALKKNVSEICDAEYANMGAVFVQLISRKTTFEMSLDLLDKLDEYSVKLIGAEFVEIDL